MDIMKKVLQCLKTAYGYQDDIHLLVKNPKIFQEFCDFRRNELTKFVGKVRQLIDNYHQVKLSIAVVSDYQFASTSKLQDWVNWCKLKYIDEVYLMAYHLGSLPVYEDCIKAKFIRKISGSSILWDCSNICWMPY